MMNTKMLILSLSLLAQKPMMIPSLMRETYVRPSIQAFGLDNKETARVSSPVDFFGTVEMEPETAVPSSSSPIMDILQSAKSFAKEVMSTVSVAAKDFYYEISDAKIVFIDDEFQQIINNVWADFLVASAPFRFGTAELLDEMASSFVQSLVLLDKKSQTFVNNLVADVLVASAPFRFGTAELLDEMTSNFVQFIQEFQAAVQDLSDVIVSKYHLINENLETFIGELLSQVPARNMIQKIMEKYQVAYKELQYSATMVLSIPSIIDADSSTFFVACQRAYAKLESFVIPVPKPAPTNLESIARDALDLIFLEYQRVNEMVASLCHHLFAPATPPPSTFWVQRISTTTAYEKLETFVKDLFAPPPPPPRTIQSMVMDVLKTDSEGYEQAYEKLEDHFLAPAAPPSPRGIESISIMELFEAVLFQYDRAYAKMEMIYQRLPRFIFSMDLMLPKLRCDLVLEESLLEYRDWMKFEERLANGRPSEYPQMEQSL